LMIVSQWLPNLQTNAPAVTVAVNIDVTLLALTLCWS
jgi:hypothetical protein